MKQGIMLWGQGRGQHLLLQKLLVLFLPRLLILLLLRLLSLTNPKLVFYVNFKFLFVCTCLSVYKPLMISGCFLAIVMLMGYFCKLP